MICALALSACATAQSAPEAPTPPAPPPGPAEQTPVLPLQTPKTFICSDGEKGTIDHDQTAGILRIVRGGEVLALQEQVGTKPQRFVTGSDAVDLDGNKATILRGFGRKAEVLATCQRIPDAPTSGVIWGTITKLDRMALAAGTKAKVMLVDAARADAPSVELAATQIVTRGNQVPLNFLLNYPDSVNPRTNTYRLQARIEGPDGKLMYITDTATFVLDTPAPQAPVDLTLVRTGS